MTFTDDARRVTDALEEYAAAARERRSPVIHQEPLARLIEDLELERLVVEGGLTGERLSRFLERYLSATTRLLHPRYLAHQVAVSHPSGSLAALVDGFTRLYAGMRYGLLSSDGENLDQLRDYLRQVRQLAPGGRQTKRNHRAR